MFIKKLLYDGATKDFPGSSDGKESACNAGDPGSIPESGRSPGEGNSNPLQYSCLENPMDKRAWEMITKSQNGLTRKDIAVVELNVFC